MYKENMQLNEPKKSGLVHAMGSNGPHPQVVNTEPFFTTNPISIEGIKPPSQPFFFFPL